METVLKVLFGAVFIFLWMIGVLASLSISLFILAAAFSIVQVLLGVGQDATLLYHILNGLGLL